MSADEVQAVKALYRDLSARTHCRDVADKLRALCPMLTNTPVETQKELIQLVQQLNGNQRETEHIDLEAELQLIREEEEAISRQNTHFWPKDSEDAMPCSETNLSIPALGQADLPGQCPEYM
eukprot:scaffold93597_cov40-Prasinocladus_malaysianus.AAC.1